MAADFEHIPDMSQLADTVVRSSLVRDNADLVDLLSVVFARLGDREHELEDFVNAILDLPEKTTPDNPPANTARLFARDNGAGKTELCVIFATGVAQIIATQP